MPLHSQLTRELLDDAQVAVSDINQLQAREMYDRHAACGQHAQGRTAVPCLAADKRTRRAQKCRDHLDACQHPAGCIEQQRSAQRSACRVHQGLL